MKRLLLIPAMLLALAAPAAAQNFTAGAAVAQHHTQHAGRYWWIPLSDCTISTATRRDGTLRGTPYVQCMPSGGIGWRSTPEPLNQADNAFGSPDLSQGTAPCDYEDVPCS